MNTETIVSTGDETQNQAPVVAESEVATPEVEVQEKVEETEAEKALKQTQRRIDKLTAVKYRVQAENEQLKQRLEQLEVKQNTEIPETDPRILAKQIARAELFTEKANALVAEGTKKHADYTTALRELAGEVGDFVKRDGTPSPFMEVVLEVAEKPTELLYHLGKNPELASELADLSPAKLAKRLDRIELDLTTPKQSKAPTPLTPVNPRGSSSKDPSNMTDREFANWRREQIKSRGAI